MVGREALAGREVAAEGGRAAGVLAGAGAGAGRESFLFHGAQRYVSDTAGLIHCVSAKMTGRLL